MTKPKISTKTFTEYNQTVKTLDRVIFPGDEPASGANKYWVVYLGKEPVGFASAIINGRECFLSRCGLLRAARGMGIQKRLIRARERWAKKQECTHLVTYTVFNNFPSIKSLTACGLIPYVPAHKYVGNGVFYFIKKIER